MAEIRHLQNRHDVIFFAVAGPTWIKFRMSCHDMSTEVICLKSKPGVEFQYNGRLGEFNGMSSKATCHIVECKNSIRHIENRSSPYFIYFFVFLMQFGLRRVAAFVSSPIHLLCTTV